MKIGRYSSQNKKIINQLNSSLDSDEEILRELGYRSEEIIQNTE